MRRLQQFIHWLKSHWRTNYKGYNVATASAAETTRRGVSVMLFAVSYTLNPNRVNPQLTEELMKSPAWMHYFDNTWFIATNEDANQLYIHLKRFFQDSDVFLIIEIRQQSSYQGWLPQEAWNWLQGYV